MCWLQTPNHALTECVNQGVLMLMHRFWEISIHKTILVNMAPFKDGHSNPFKDDIHSVMPETGGSWLQSTLQFSKGLWETEYHEESTVDQKTETLHGWYPPFYGQYLSGSSYQVMSEVFKTLVGSHQTQGFFSKILLIF